VFSYDGTAWQGPPLVDPDAGTGSISCSSTRFCMVVEPGDDVTTYNGTRWGPRRHITIISLTGTNLGPATTPLTTVACTSSTFCVWSDSAGHVYLYDGSDWGWVQTVDPGADITTVSCPAHALCMAADTQGNVVVGTPAKA
jgi:hypothetical protein